MKGRAKPPAEELSMLDHLVFLECPARLKKEIRAYWSAKGPRFERLLSGFPPEPCRRRLVVHRAKSRWEAKAVLSMPTAILAARRDAASWAEALDGVADRLTSALRRHRDRRRHDDARLRRAPWPTAS